MEVAQILPSKINITIIIIIIKNINNKSDSNNNNKINISNNKIYTIWKIIVVIGNKKYNKNKTITIVTIVIDRLKGSQNIFNNLNHYPNSRE